jgi:hypothetical protein
MSDAPRLDTEGNAELEPEVLRIAEISLLKSAIGPRGWSSTSTQYNEPSTYGHVGGWLTLLICHNKLPKKASGQLAEQGFFDTSHPCIPCGPEKLHFMVVI